ncbi:MAG TPA: NAD(P)/FAD-dependent oxidoreductase [bacterium]|nr:NAD(P)/FAD-dependent oxidoreductase [bacterium]
MEARKKVVIVGAGFGGLYAGRRLANKNVRVTIVDRRNHHLFQPLLYQVATAALNPADIAVPVRQVLSSQANAFVRMSEATSIDVAARRVHLRDGVLDYDFLILATGAMHSYFGNDAWAPLAPGLKTIEDALAIRRKVFLAFEAAEKEEDEAARTAWLTFVIVGGGPTGVELAGALAEIAHRSMARDFRRIDPAKARILLVEGQPQLVPMYPEKLRREAEESLVSMGVEVRGAARVTVIDERGVVVNGERIEARTVVWAAGNKASPLAAGLGVPLDKAGRVMIEPDLTIPGHREVFVIGDLAVLTQGGKPVTGLAPIAIQEGKHAAGNIRRALRGEPYEPFHYLDKGSFSTIGRGSAVGQLFGRWDVDGFPAWLAWLFIHILFLIGFRNRVLVMLQWAWSYLTWQRGARLITGGEAPPALPPDHS